MAQVTTIAPKHKQEQYPELVPVAQPQPMLSGIPVDPNDVRLIVELARALEKQDTEARAQAQTPQPPSPQEDKYFSMGKAIRDAAGRVGDTVLDPRLWGAEGRPSAGSESFIDPPAPSAARQRVETARMADYVAPGPRPQPMRQHPDDMSFLASPRVSSNGPQPGSGAPDASPVSYHGPEPRVAPVTQPPPPSRRMAGGPPASQSGVPQGAIALTPTRQPQTAPAPATAATPGMASSPPGAQSSSQLAQMVQRYMDTVQDPSAIEAQREKDQWLALMQAGLGTMAAASEPGAGLFGSLGRGGTAGIKNLMASRKMRNRDRQSAAAENLRLMGLLSAQENAQATRESTAAYRNADLGIRRETLDERRRSNTADEKIATARAAKSGGGSAEAKRSTSINTLLKIKDQAREAAKDVMGTVDPVRYQEEYKSLLNEFGLVSYPKSQAEVDSLSKGAYFYNPGSGEIEVRS